MVLSGVGVIAETGAEGVAAETIGADDEADVAGAAAAGTSDATGATATGAPTAFCGCANSAKATANFVRNQED